MCVVIAVSAVVAAVYSSGGYTRDDGCSHGNGKLVAVDVFVVVEGEGCGLSSALGSASALGSGQRFPGAIDINPGPVLGVSDRLM